jgi:predicted nucleotidyltransferase component of viral defense system
MVSIEEIEQYYPENLRVFKRFLLREYLQFKLLEIIFNGPHTDKLCFLGGTCLRLVHNNQRFSEDLDFDNFNLTDSDFNEISKNIELELQKSGYKIEIQQKSKGAYHCYIRFPSLLFEQGLSGYQNEKILIQLDTEAQHFEFKPEHTLLNKFDVFTKINTTPLDLLMAQKCFAILNRPRNKGRDFFDLVFLMGKNISPNFAYLNQKIGVDNWSKLKSRLLKKCASLNMHEMTLDVAPFLFQEKQRRQVLLFPEYLKQYQPVD